MGNLLPDHLGIRSSGLITVYPEHRLVGPVHFLVLIGTAALPHGNIAEVLVSLHGLILQGSLSARTAI